jgi:hypothetical protein
MAGLLFISVLPFYKDYVLSDPFRKRALSGCEGNPIPASDYHLPSYLGKLRGRGWSMRPIPAGDYHLPSYLGKLRGRRYKRWINALLTIKFFLDSHTSFFLGCHAASFLIFSEKSLRFVARICCF